MSLFCGSQSQGLGTFFDFILLCLSQTLRPLINSYIPMCRFLKFAKMYWYHITRLQYRYHSIRLQYRYHITRLQYRYHIIRLQYKYHITRLQYQYSVDIQYFISVPVPVNDLQ